MSDYSVTPKARGERLVHMYANRKIMGKPVNTEMKRAWSSSRFFYSGKSKYLPVIRLMGNN